MTVQSLQQATSSKETTVVSYDGTCRYERLRRYLRYERIGCVQVYDGKVQVVQKAMRQGVRISQWYHVGLLQGLSTRNKRDFDQMMEIKREETD